MHKFIRITQECQGKRTKISIFLGAVEFLSFTAPYAKLGKVFTQVIDTIYFDCAA
jgi:hypothetical protein|tara:strand:+ start:1195 stop:1359 length:165 start_codon:yes stop_codon:yes gene_type:complete